MREGWQRNGTPGKGVRLAGDQRQFVIKIDNATAEEVIGHAQRTGVSTAHMIRLLIEWGLEAVE